mgnify:CR=1 FL=1
MSEPSILFFEVNERQGVFHRRAFLMGGLAGAGLLALGGRLAQLQLVEAQRYQKLSAGNQFNYRLMPPPRGLILDRNGTPLASNRPNFRLLVTKDKDLDAEAVLDDLAKLAGHVGRAHPDVQVGFDLADMGGYAYYSGVRFAVYAPGATDAVLRGGRLPGAGAHAQARRAHPRDAAVVFARHPGPA